MSTSGVELASAYISLVPSLRGVQREISRQMGPIGTRVGQQFGSDFNSGASREVDGEEITGDATGKAGGFGKKFGKLFGVAAAAGIGASIAGAIKEAGSQEVATDKLAASLGLNDKQAANLGASAGRLYADNFGDSFADVTGALGAVKGSFRNLDGGQLEKVTGLAISFSDIFDVDLPRAVQVAQTAVSSGFAKNATNALDIFTKGLQGVSPALREPVLDAVEEYGQFFQQVGIDGPEAMGLLVGAASKGQFGVDKIGDAVKEFTLLSTDMSGSSVAAFDEIGLSAEDISDKVLKGGDAARDATQQVIDGLLGIKNPSKQANAAVALFGAPIEDLNKGEIPAFLKSLKAGEDGLGKFRGAAQKASDTASDNAASNIEKFKRTITQTFVETLGGKVIPAIRDFADGIATKYGPQIRELGDYFTNDVVPAIKSFADYVAKNVAPIVADVIANVVTTVVDLREQFRGTFDSIKSIFTSTVSIVQSIWSKFGDNIKTFTSGFIGAVVRIIRGAFDVVAGIFQTIASVLRGDWRGAWDGIKQIVRGAVGIVKGLVSGLFNNLRLGFSVGFKALKGIASDAWEGVKTIVRNGVDRVVDFVTGLPGKIKAIGGDMKEAGKALIGKFLDGLKALGALGSNVASNLMNGIIGPINSAIRSINDAIPNKIPLPGLPDINLPDNPFPTIPGYARGTLNARGGLSVVGENGPELITMDRGCRVYTAAESRALMTPAASSSMPKSLILSIGGRDFVAYVSEIADSRVDSAADLYEEGQRATWARMVG